MPKYNPEVKVFEVRDADGTFLAVFTSDSFPRPGKRGGAWCGRLRGLHFEDGKEVRPIVTNVTNFTRPVGDAPRSSRSKRSDPLPRVRARDSPDPSRGPYRSTGRTPRDFVELPSQIMENWALEPEVLKLYAKHGRRASRSRRPSSRRSAAPGNTARDSGRRNTWRRPSSTWTGTP